MSAVAYLSPDRVADSPVVGLKRAAKAVLKVDQLRVELLSGQDVIADISFTMHAGEILGLVGESGSGKTTLATALLAHARKGARISQGSISIGDLSLLSLQGEDLRRARGSVVGYVPQDPAMALNPAIRIGKLLRETLHVHAPSLGDAHSTQRLQQTLIDVGLPNDPPFLARFPHQLSGGQQQRVLLALAFILSPRLIVLDEPTTALDVVTQAHILETLRQLCKSKGVAAVYVSHDLAVIKDLVDRVMVMYAGRIVEAASRERLFAAPSHPYTAGLLAAIPDVAQRRPLAPITGHAPAPGHRPGGCFFAARCSRVLAQCLSLSPALTPHANDHLLACYSPVPQCISLADQALVEVSAPPTRPVLLDIHHLNITYDRQVVFDLSMQIQQGECLALVGESGSGKTSLARVLAGLGENVEGEVIYAGKPLSFSAAHRPAALRHQIQYIFQNPYRALNPRQTIGSSLAAPLVYFFGLAGEALTLRIHQALSRVSLPISVAHAYPDSLSGGERQRVSIARALVCNPRLLICDEITSALDVSVQASILALLRELQADGLTILFVTHDLGVVRAIADRVVVLQHGRLVEQGHVDEVLDRPQAAYTQTLLSHSPRLSGDVIIN